MIRDPSDGSVREKPAADARAAGVERTTGIIPAMQTALPPLPIDAKESARLEKAREWLREYHKPRSPEQGEG